MTRQKIILEVSVISEKPLDDEYKESILNGMIDGISSELHTYADDVVKVDVVPLTSENSTTWLVEEL